MSLVGVAWGTPQAQSIFLECWYDDSLDFHIRLAMRPMMRVVSHPFFPWSFSLRTKRGKRHRWELYPSGTDFSM